MIIDDYYCIECENIQEIIIKDGKIEDVCEKCGGELKKYFGSLNFQLKGNGWASKGSAHLGPPKRTKIADGVKVDLNKKRIMEEQGYKF